MLDIDAELHQTGLVNETLIDRLLEMTGSKSERALALGAGIEQSKLHRQLVNGVKVETIVAICRAYDLPFLPVFVLAGFITEDEAEAMAVDKALHLASERQLVEEMLRRVASGEATPEITDPVSADAIHAVVGDEEKPVSPGSFRVTRIGTPIDQMSVSQLEELPGAANNDAEANEDETFE